MAAERSPIYLDYAASTPLDPRVRAAMLDWLGDEQGYANPASTHRPGALAAAAVEAAREQVAELIGAEPEALVWTSGATEANNLALIGAARLHRERGRHLVTLRSEHKSVLAPMAQLAREGFEISYLEVGRDGLVDPDRLAAALRPDTLLVSVMQVNNETGVVQPLAAIAERVKARGALLHVDAVQGLGRLALNLESLPADLVSLSAHKVYGPKGVGALYVRRRPRLRLQPLLWGGGQEGGLRSGTVPVHQVVGMGEACRVAAAALASEPRRVATLRDALWAGLAPLDGVVRHGRPDGAPHILNLGFVGVHGEALAAEIEPWLAVSGSSACSSVEPAPSHVLRAMGVPGQLAHASLRLSLGRFSTEQDVGAAVEGLRAAVERLRAFSPLWRAFQSGVPLERLYGPEGAADAA